MKELSGGNIQKFILARMLGAGPGLIVCHKPTYGLDAGTVAYIQELLRTQCDQGASVLLISPDMEELLNVSDRIGVLYRGELTAIMDRDEAAPERIGRLMTGLGD